MTDTHPMENRKIEGKNSSTDRNNNPIPQPTSEDNQESRDVCPRIDNWQDFGFSSGSFSSTFKQLANFPQKSPLGKLPPLSAIKAPRNPHIELGTGDMTCKSATYSRNECMSPANRRWKLVKNTVRAIVHFQTPQDDISREIESYASNFTHKNFSFYSNFKSPIHEVRKELKVFQYAARGSQQDVEKLENLLVAGPKVYLYLPEDERSTLNKKNPNGLTPLFVATINGNIKIIEVLLRNKANPFIKSTVAPGEEETILEAACRWGYVKVVQFFLDKVAWPLAALQDAYTKGTKPTKAIVQAKIDEYKKDYSCMICSVFCCPKSQRIAPATKGGTK